jgi:hypothetical protein
MDTNDPRWDELWGGYQVDYDPRPALARLHDDIRDKAAWHELWQELYHQGAIGSASYAAVPLVVDVYSHSAAVDWNPYALVATIELARDEDGDNIDVPRWLEPSYTDALERLACHGIDQLPTAMDSETVRSILSVLAIWKGERRVPDLGQGPR